MNGSLYCVVIMISLFHSAHLQQQTSDQFRQMITKSRQDCVSGRQAKATETRYDRGECGADTIEQMYVKVPGGKATVNLYAPYEFKRTLALCITRENKQGTDWNVMIANRHKLGASATTDVWTDCQTQITAERVDCKNAKNVLCAFEHGTAFECVPDAQRQRTSTTIEHGDKCYEVEALADGRPQNATDFNQRIAASKHQCATNPADQQTEDKNNQFVNQNCAADPKMSTLMTRFPNGIDQNRVLAEANRQPGLHDTVTMCINREQAGFAQIRARSNAAQFASERATCQVQLTQDQTDCKTAHQLVCAFSFGVDFSCWKQVLANRQGSAAKHDPCQEIVNDLITNPSG